MENNKNVDKNANDFFCEICDFKCRKLSNYNTHLLTAKHKRPTHSCLNMPKNTETQEKIRRKNYEKMTSH